MKQKTRTKVLYVLLLLSLIGLGVAGYQSYEHYAYTPSICDYSESFSCSVVTESKWGEFPFHSGISLALYGVVWWLILIGIIWFTLKKKIKDGEYYFAIWSGFGLLTALYLLAVEVYFLPLETGVIVICPLCTVQHVLIAVMAIASYFLLKKPFKKYKLDPRPVFVLVVIGLIAVGGYFILWKQVGGQQQFAFTECLAEKDATMYGFKACPNCNKQKYILGEEAFTQHIEDTGRYVLCRPEAEALKAIGDRLEVISILPDAKVTKETTQGELCAMMVGRGTPTWIIDGKQVDGWQTLQELADLSGCPLPEGVQ